MRPKEQKSFYYTSHNGRTGLRTVLCMLALIGNSFMLERGGQKQDVHGLF